MTSNFNELYLENISIVCGDMLNYAVNVCDEDGDEFLRKFIESGIEIAMDILGQLDCKESFLSNTTKEYWAAYVLAKLKFNTELSFEEILKHLPFSKILELYHPLHEADITKFFEVARQYMLIRQYTGRLA